MCGISLTIGRAKRLDGGPGDLLRRRGPDLCGAKQVTALAADGNCLHLDFAASLLQLRGLEASSAVPLHDAASGDILCFNGEVFGGLSIADVQNDGLALLHALGGAAAVPALLGRLRGPWALIYWNQATGTLWFGRDVMGRRSLLAHYPQMPGSKGEGGADVQQEQPEQFMLTSVAWSTPLHSSSSSGSSPLLGSGAVPRGTGGPTQQSEGKVAGTCGGEEGEEEDGSGPDPTAYWQDLPPGVYSMKLAWAAAAPRGDLLQAAAEGRSEHGFGDSGAVGTRAGGQRDGGVQPAGEPWRQLPWGSKIRRHAWTDPLLCRLESYARAEGGGGPGTGGSSGSSVQCTEIRTSADTPVIKASGAECDVMAAAGQHLTAASTALVPGGDDDGDEAPRADARSSSSLPWALGTCWDPGSAVEAVLIALQAAMEVRCRGLDSVLAVGRGSLLEAASGCLLTALSHPPAAASPVLVLFSGGVDSVLVAALAHRCLPPGLPLDLCNVCFDAGRSPDRVAARAALRELSTWAPGRLWRLIEVDATLEDTDLHKDHLLSLLHPSSTVMDLNIGAALWLAASGSGRLTLPLTHSVASPEAVAASGADQSVPVCSDAGGTAYCSSARVVLLGHGADEQCAGYGRHRTRFRHGGPGALAAELSLDVRRMWLRNCGRDDRLVADRGREARHPFLDEGVMELLLGLPLHCIADLRQAPGLGDKSVLRQALVRLGLPEAARRVKRAIQFGSRIGKLSNRREFGSNRAANKLNAGSLQLSQLPTAAEACERNGQV